MRPVRSIHIPNAEGIQPPEPIVLAELYIEHCL